MAAIMIARSDRVAPTSLIRIAILQVFLFSNNQFDKFDIPNQDHTGFRWDQPMYLG
jgi:hypothetical protein